MRTLLRLCLALAVVASVSNASAAPVVNQIVPIAVYHNAPGAFGLAYDSVNNLIWSSNVSSQVMNSWTPFNSFTPAQIAAFPVIGGVYQINAGPLAGTTTAGVGFPRALAFDAAPPGGSILYDTNGGGNIIGLVPGSVGVVNNPAFASVPAGTSFLDGFDYDGGNIYLSPEPASTGGDSYRNASIFLDNSNAAQTQDGAALNIVRWAGIELAAGSIFTVADSIGTSGRTIARYDPVTGALLGYDPDGTPFANRLEDLAFDGRYLYGSDFANNQIFVFDITGPGGLAPVPEPASMALWGIAGLGMLVARRRRVAR